MTLPIRRLTSAEISAKPTPDASTPPPMLPTKPTPVRDARKNVQSERSELADARAKLMSAKQAQQSMMAERERMMAEKAAKETTPKPPPMLPTPKPPPMPDRPMPRPPQKPMSGGLTGNISKTIQDAVNKMPTSSGGVMGGVTNAVQGAVNKMPTPVQNVIEPPVESSANSFSPMNASPAVEDGLGSAMKTMGMKRGGNVKTTRISTSTRSKKSPNW